MMKFRRLLGLLLVASVAMSAVVILGAPAMAKFNRDEPNEGGVVVEEGDAPDCVSGSCGGMIVEDPAGAGPNCDWGNCGGSVCAGPDCGSCVGGNCGGSISGTSKDKAKDKAVAKAGSLPKTGVTLPLASTMALGVGLVLVGLAFLYMGDPSTKFAMSAMGYHPRRRA